MERWARVDLDTRRLGLGGSSMDSAWTGDSCLDMDSADFSFLHVARIGAVSCVSLFAGFWRSHGDIDRHVGIDGDLSFDCLACAACMFLPQLFFVCVYLFLLPVAQLATLAYIYRSFGGALCANPMALEFRTRINSILQ